MSTFDQEMGVTWADDNRPCRRGMPQGVVVSQRVYTSPAGRTLLRLMGEGRTLEIRSGACTILPSRYEPTASEPIEAPIEAPLDAFRELKSAGLIYRLTEEGEPPVSKRLEMGITSWRCGWRELGLDGRDCELWVCMQ